MLGQSRRVRAFESTRRRLAGTGLLDGTENAGATIVFTSRNQGDGVSTIVTGLANACGAAEPGQVLVVDADDTGRRACNYLRTSPPTFSFENARAALDNAESSVISRAPNGLDLLVLDGQIGNESAATGMQDFLTKMRQRYRVVLIDAGSLYGKCAHPWLRCGAKTVLVIDASSTTIEALRRVRSEGDQAGLELAAFILNKRRYPVPEFVYRWLA